MDENRQQKKKKAKADDEEHLVAQRCAYLESLIFEKTQLSKPKSKVYRPGYRAKSDADILRDAKLEAMGLPPREDSPRRRNYERNQMATDEMVRLSL